MHKLTKISTDINFIPIQSSLHILTETSTDINVIPIQFSLQKVTEISTDINFIPIQSSFHSLTREIYQPLLINDYQSTGLCNYTDISHNSTEGVIWLCFE